MRDDEIFHIKRGGFSAVQLMIALGLGSVLLFMASSLFTAMNRESNKAFKMMENTSSQALAFARLSKDIQQSGMSMNLVNLDDDNGRTFFDFYGEIRCAANCSRVFTLTSSNQMIMIISNQLVHEGQSLLYPPQAAYSWPPLRFRSLNYNSYLDQQAPGVWRNGNLLFLSSAISLYSYASNGMPDLTIPAKPLVFTGYVDNDNLRAETIGNLLRNTHPSKPTQTVDTADEFFRILPGTGGQSTLSFVRAVTAVRYWVKPVTMKGKTSGNLMRSVWQPLVRRWSSGELVATNIVSVVFNRQDVSSTVIQITLKSASATVSWQSNGSGELAYSLKEGGIR